MTKSTVFLTVEHAIRISDKMLSVVKLRHFNGDAEYVKSWIHDIRQMTEEQIKQRVLDDGYLVDSVVKFEFPHNSNKKEE